MNNQPSFFAFGTKLSRRAARVSFAGWDSPEDVKADSPDAGRLLIGEYGSMEFPVRFEQRSGMTFGDVLETRTAILFLISDRLKRKLDEESLSGWTTFDVGISDRHGNPVFGYYGLSVTGRSGPIDLKKSKVIRKRLVPEGPVSTYYQGRFIRPEEWDGSDFFLPQGHFGIMVSNRAAAILRRGAFTNLLLRNTADIEIDEFTAKIIKSKA